jgi:hypothetical protein
MELEQINGQTPSPIPEYPGYFALKPDEIYSIRKLKTGSTKIKKLTPYLSGRDKNIPCVSISKNGKPTSIAVTTLMKLAFPENPVLEEPKSVDTKELLIVDEIDPTISDYDLYDVLESTKRALEIKKKEIEDRIKSFDFDKMDEPTRAKIISQQFLKTSGDTREFWANLCVRYKIDPNEFIENEPGFTSEESDIIIEPCDTDAVFEDIMITEEYPLDRDITFNPEQGVRRPRPKLGGHKLDRSEIQERLEELNNVLNMHQWGTPQWNAIQKEISELQEQL